MQNKFENKVVLITGAAGGIGQSTVRRFAAQGAKIMAADLDEESLQESKRIAEKLGAEIHLLPGDLADAKYSNELPQLAFDLGKRLDVLVNNAGLMRRGNILDTSDQDWAVTMEINVNAIFRTCRSAIKIMKSRGGGSIVNTASCWGIYPGPDHVAYCTSKAAVAAMTKCLGRDHAGDGIRVNAVCPNEVNTPMLRTGFEIRGLDPDTAVETLNQTVPIGRIADPEEIADVIAYLASDDASYVCGSLIEINGAKPVY